MTSELSPTGNGREPALGAGHPSHASGLEPMLGGGRRERIDREVFRLLLNIEDRIGRHRVIERILDQGAGRYYGAAMTAVLTPGARHHQIGRLWKVAFSYEQRLAAMDSLVKLDPERALSGLIIAIGNDDTTLQRAAIWLIGQLEDGDADRVLIAILEDDRQEIRHAAVQALGHRWDQPQISRLANLHSAVVAEAASWLASHADSRVIPILVSILKDQRRGSDNHLWAQISIVRALGVIARRFADEAGDQVIVVLRQILDHRVAMVLHPEAINALEMIGTDNARAAAVIYTADSISPEIR